MRLQKKEVKHKISKGYQQYLDSLIKPQKTKILEIPFEIYAEITDYFNEAQDIFVLMNTCIEFYNFLHNTKIFTNGCSHALFHPNFKQFPKYSLAYVKNLTFRKNRWVEEDEDSYIKRVMEKCPNVIYVNISRFAVSVNIFKCLKNVKILVLRNTRMRKDNGFIPSKYDLEYEELLKEFSTFVFKYLEKVEKLDISGSNYICDESFRHLKNLKVLKMDCCNQRIITDNAFKILQENTKLKKLSMEDSTKTITANCIPYLKDLELLHIGSFSNLWFTKEEKFLRILNSIRCGAFYLV